MPGYITSSISAINYLSGALTDRFNRKEWNTYERELTFKGWWQEQIRLYGTEIDYYVRNFELANTDKVYGENTYQGFHPKATFVMLVNLTDGNIAYSQYGLVSDDELTAVIDIETYQQNLSGYYDDLASTLPKSGDVFQLTEYGSGRPLGNGKIFEITERLDEKVDEMNQLQGHYIFRLRARRNDHAFLPGLNPEENSTQVTDTSGIGSISSPETDYINDLDTEQASYFNYGDNDDVYGDYY